MVRVDSLQRQAYIWNSSYKSCFCWSRMQKCFCLEICEWLFPVVFVNMWNCIYICFWLKIVCLFASHSLLVRQFPALDVESCCCSRKNWLKIPRLAGCWWLSVLHLSHPGYHLFGLTFLDNFASNETKGQPHSAKSELQNLSGIIENLESFGKVSLTFYKNKKYEYFEKSPKKLNLKLQYLNLKTKKRKNRASF